MVARWIEGETGFPFIDCFMRELKTTGYCNWLVVFLEHDFYFPIQLGILIPIDELIFFIGVGQPPAR